jgi:hypothetical protein
MRAFLAQQKPDWSAEQINREVAMLRTRTTVIDRGYVAKWAAFFGCASLWEDVQRQARWHTVISA